MRVTVTLADKPISHYKDGLYFDVEFATVPRKGELIQIFVGGQAMFGEVVEVLWGFDGDNRSKYVTTMIFAKNLDANDSKIPGNNSPKRAAE